MYFPDNYKWSLSLALLIASIDGGGAEFGEIHWAAQSLREAAGRDDVEAWYAAWDRLARKVAAIAAQAERDGGGQGAARAWLRAASYHQIAERLIDPADPRKVAAYRASLGCFDHALANGIGHSVKRVAIPYEGSHLSALWLPPIGAAGGAAPAVVFFDGLDVNKEQLYCFAGRRLAEHGVGVLIVDGPGSGESIRLEGHRLRHDYEVAAAAALDTVRGLDGVDPDRVGLLAVSLGGYHVGRVMARNPGFAAAASWGGMWDYHAVWLKRQRLSVGSAVSADHAHICWMLGVDTLDEALTRLEAYTLADEVARITAPILIVHGAGDKQIPLADAEREFEAIASADKRLIVLDEEDFGTQHAQIDNMAMAHLHLFGWLARTLRVTTAARPLETV
jgi:dipeptidyl aminopeptidase/acylaminoacyl peptidase